MSRSGVVLVVVALAATAAAVAPGGVAANHGVDSVDYAVTPGDPAPGAEEVNYVFGARLVDNFGDERSGIEEPTRVVFSFAGDVSGCESEVGILDSFTLTNTNNNDQQEEMDAEASFSDGTAEFDVSNPEEHPYTVNDLLRLELEGCVTNPGEKGWYQADLVVEGKAFGSDEQVTLSSTSHYVPVCEGCDDGSTAREELGPPPSQQSETTATPTPTPTPTPSPTPTPTPTPTEASSDSTPTPTSTPFPTPTQTPTPSPTPTPTPTEASSGDALGDPFGGEGPLGVDPLVVVGLVAAVSMGVAAFGATRL